MDPALEDPEILKKAKPVKAEKPAPEPVKKEEREPEPEKAAEPEPVKEEPKEPETVNAITASELKVFAATQAKAGHRAELKKLLGDYGQKTVTDLTENLPDKMQEFYDKLREATNAG